MPIDKHLRRGLLKSIDALAEFYRKGQRKRTHVRVEDIRLSPVHELATEVCCEWTTAVLVVLDSYVAIRRECAGLCSTCYRQQLVGRSEV